MMFSWPIFFEAIISIAPCILLCYLPFTQNLKRGAQKIFIEAGAACIAYSVLIGFIPFTPQEESGNVYLIPFLLIGFIYYVKTIDENLPKPLFVFCMVLNIASFAGSADILSGFLIEGWQFVRSGVVWSLLMLLMIRALTFPVFGVALYQWFGPALRHIRTRDMRLLWVIPVIFSAIQIFYSEESFQRKSVNPMYPLLFVMLTAALFFVYYIILRMLKNTAANARLSENARMTKLQLILQDEQYKMLTKNIMESRAARHDLRHHISIIKAYADSDDNESLKKYLTDYERSLPVDTEEVYCGNYAVNAIVRYYLSKAKGLGADIIVEIDIPETIGINNSDLCVIFGNCLENAVEACKRMESGWKYIRLKTKLTAQTLGITIDNSYDGRYQKENSHFMSRKHKGIGIGISSVLAVAEKYTGTATFEGIGNEFQSSILLYVQTAKTDQ